MASILLLVAMEAELARAPRRDMQLVHTGIGKVNAAWRCAEALAQHRPDLVVNFGTAGAVTPGLSGLLEVGATLQRDMDLRSLGLSLGTTPFEDDSAIIRFSHAPLTCGTGDSFVAAPPAISCDLVDMGLYAIAKVCRAAGVPLRAFKYVSDRADSAAPTDWTAALQHAEAAFLQWLQAGELDRS